MLRGFGLALEPLEFIQALKLLTRQHYVCKFVIFSAEVFFHGGYFVRLDNARMPVIFNTNKLLSHLGGAAVGMLWVWVLLAANDFATKIGTTP